MELHSRPQLTASAWVEITCDLACSKNQSTVHRNELNHWHRGGEALTDGSENDIQRYEIRVRAMKDAEDRLRYIPADNTIAMISLSTSACIQRGIDGGAYIGTARDTR